MKLNDAKSIYLGTRPVKAVYIGTKLVWSSTDADATAFITAANITDATQKSAINTLVKDLKSAGLWDRHQAIYPVVGGTALAHSLNLKNPQNTDAAYRIALSGTYEHNAKGLRATANNSYGNTFINPVALAVTNTMHSMSIYVNNDFSPNTTDQVEIGLGASGVNINIQTRYRGNLAYNVGTSGAVSAVNTRNGFSMGTRQASNLSKVFKNGVMVGTTGLAAPAYPNLNAWVVSRNNSNTPNALYSRSVLSFFSFAFGAAISDAEALTFYNIVQKYQTTLGRQV